MARFFRTTLRHQRAVPFKEALAVRVALLDNICRALRLFTLHVLTSQLVCAAGDWVYSDAWDAFILAVDGTTGAATTLTVWSGSLSTPLATLELNGNWTEGPGLVHTVKG
jgi:hypothetical protein